MISCAAGRCLNFVTFSLKTEKEPMTGYWNRQSEKEITHCVYENAHIIFMNIFKIESNDHQEEMKKDQLDLAESGNAPSFHLSRGPTLQQQW